jgi:fumarate hydratase subunit beta
MIKSRKITLPFTKKDLKSITAGEKLLLSGRLIAARDEAHKRLVAILQQKKKLPISLKNAVIYYVGPSPERPGAIIGSAGPTTAKRMDKYTKDMIECGVTGMIGKGERGEETKRLIKGKAIYMAALGGTGAKLSHAVLSQKIVAFEDAGMEALRIMEVKDFPVIIIHDLAGNDAYSMLRSNS